MNWYPVPLAGLFHMGYTSVAKNSYHQGTMAQLSFSSVTVENVLSGLLVPSWLEALSSPS